MALSDALPATNINNMPVATTTAATTDADDPVFVKSYAANKWDIWMLGISIGLGGQYFSWNAGLHAGLYTFFIDFVVVGAAYFALCCCTSEITGALPFAGGAYGLSRCTLGYYPGFLIGCAEAAEYIAYVSTSVMSLAKMVVEIIPQLEGYEPLIWLIVYSHACYVHYRGDRVFWRWNFVIGSTSLIIVLIYIFGSSPHVDFYVNADTSPDYRFVNGVDGFLKSLPLACWFFVGVEALNLASDDVVDAPRAIPFAQLGCIATLFSVGLVVFFVTVSLPPPGLTQVAKLLAPFDNGFHIMFGIPVATTTLFSIPGMYATSFGFMWGYGKLISAMATSKLLPPILARTSDKYDTPINAVLFGSALGYLLSLIVHFVPSIDDYMYNVCITAAFLGYAGQCVGYISMKRFYPGLSDSTFQSPFGIAGAAYSLVVWILGLISVVFFQDRYTIEFAAFAVLVLMLSLFYVLYAKEHQTFSEQESKVFFMAHVMKFNRKKQSKRQLVQKNPPRKRHRHLHAKHTPVIHAEPIEGQVLETRPSSPTSRRGSGSTGPSATDLKPLALPVVKWLPYASPFYRYFVNPKFFEAEYERALAIRKSLTEIESSVLPDLRGLTDSRTDPASETKEAAEGGTTIDSSQPLAERMNAYIVPDEELTRDLDSRCLSSRVRTPVQPIEMRDLDSQWDLKMAQQGTPRKDQASTERVTKVVQEEEEE